MIQYRVQQKRHAALERARSQEKLAKMKEDRLIRREIVAATRESYGIKYPSIGDKWVAAPRDMNSASSADNSSFFITDGQ